MLQIASAAIWLKRNVKDIGRILLFAMCIRVCEDVGTSISFRNRCVAQGTEVKTHLCSHGSGAVGRLTPRLLRSIPRWLCDRSHGG